jgi:protein subunit release factor A
MNDEDVELQQWPQRRYGGQHVGTPIGIIAIHKPTGVAVIEQSERSMHRNRIRAIARLQSLLDAIGEDEDERTP